MTSAKPLALIGGAGALAAVGTAAAAHVWARHIEINLFEIRALDLHVLPSGAQPIRVLHMSDAHLLPEQTKKREFLRSLASLEPDLVVNTGDNVASEDAIDAIARDIAPLLERPGLLALGSNDKYAAGKRNILRYLLRDPRPKNFRDGVQNEPLEVERLVAKLTAGGWTNVSNARALIELPGCDVEVVGVDDPHLEHDEFPPVDPACAARGTRPSVKIGVTHAPYKRVLDQFVDDGCDLIFAGHTHGGQLALPHFGAIVTNCDLHRSQAKGLSVHRGVPLHVSGGIGASPFYNMRFANRPEVTLLTLKPRLT